jgi:hypothetical protein
VTMSDTTIYNDDVIAGTDGHCTVARCCDVPLTFLINDMYLSGKTAKDDKKFSYCQCGDRCDSLWSHGMIKSKPKAKAENSTVKSDGGTPSFGRESWWETLIDTAKVKLLVNLENDSSASRGNKP